MSFLPAATSVSAAESQRGGEIRLTIAALASRSWKRWVLGWGAAGMLLGEALAGGIGNLVFRDNNLNRFFDPGDTPMAGVLMHLYAEGMIPGTDVPLQFMFTDANGRYLFTGLADGNYFVFIPPTNFTSGGALVNTRSVTGTPGPPDSDDDVGENGIDSAQPRETGIRSGIVVLRAGTAPVSEGTETGEGSHEDDAADADTDLTIDFGFETFITRIGDFVWLDTNRDGLQDPGEPGLGGVPVQLFDGNNNNFLGNTTTAADGFFAFTGLPAGSYYLHFPTTLFPYVLTKAEQDPADLLDSDASVSTGLTPIFTLANLENKNLKDAGYVVDRPDIGDYIFHDLNANGVQDAGEAGLAGVTVELYTAAGALAGSTVSNASGYYRFVSVDPGSYYLQFPVETAAGLVLSVADNAFDDITDSDADPVTGRTPVFTAVAGQDDESWDAGYHAPPAAIKGTVWHDVDADGVRDPGEPVLPGVPVDLMDADFGFVVESTVTDASGRYQFSNLIAIPWQVRFPLYTGAGQRYQITTANVGGDDLVDSDASASDGLTPPVVPENGEQTVYDAGYRNVRLGIGNGVYWDANGNGIFNNGEGVGGVQLHLYHTGDNPAVQAPRQTVLTDFDGIYLFNNLSPGQYFVLIPALNFQSGGPLAGLISLPGAGSDNGVDDNAANSDNGDDPVWPAGRGVRSHTITLTTGNEPRTGVGFSENGRAATIDDADDPNVDLTVDFGFTRGMTLGNLVFADESGNGRYNNGEGTDGVTVQLFASGATPGSTPPIASTLTAGGGFYLFEGFAGGSYFVHLPASNFQPGQPLAGHLSIAGAGLSADADDDVDENGIDSPDPHLTGISSRVFPLSPGNAPTAASGETGAGSTLDDTADNFGMLTVDFGFVPGLPTTYAIWRQRYLPAGANAPAQDADGDGLSNGLEYLFHLPPAGGVTPQQALSLVPDPQTGSIDAVLVLNPLTTDSQVVLQYRPELANSAGPWTPVSTLTPSDTPLPDGRVERRWSDLESIPGLENGTGFVRALAALDTDGDDVPDHHFPTAVLGWRDRSHQTGLATSGSAFLHPAMFSGTVGSAAGGALSLGTSVGAGNLETLFGPGSVYYAEITSGSAMGHRFEIDEAATAGAVLQLVATHPLNTLAALPDLTGAGLVVRPHWTLAGLYPPDQFQGTSNPATADQILCYPRPSFQSWWLLNDNGSQRWVRTDDATLADAGGRIIPPGEGFFVDRRADSLTVLDVGEVRSHRMARVLTAGTTLVTSGWPLPGSPVSWGLRLADGFTGNTNPVLADNFQTWRGDAPGGQQALRSFFLLEAGPPWQYWADKSDALLGNQNEVPHFAPGRGVFLQLRATVPDSFEPCPWTP